MAYLHYTLAGPARLEKKVLGLAHTDRPQQGAAPFPIRPRAEPTDVANVVLFLASPDAGYVTGQVIYVDAGIGQAFMTLPPRPDDVPGPPPAMTQY